ncbi:BnaC09g53410D [Brassica napus]|uniref:BnaC09g53410D protein n=1 Tax=Brassica napus TaxID=3708 RepID=A0A078ISA3_BRANA|nr:BnaC09g53410D [Brassica napus]
MDSNRDGQKAKKGREEQGRKARNQEQKLDKAETEELQALGINEYVVLNKGCSKLVKEDRSKENKNKKAKGFTEEKKHKMEGDEEKGEL